jgi:hypothetical protein
MKKQIFTFLIVLALLFTAACTISTENSPISSTAASSGNMTATEITSSSTQSSIGSSASTSTAVEVTTMPIETHEAEGDYTWNASDEIAIKLEGDKITATSSGVIINGSIATIVSSGTYRLNGTLNDGQIVVNSDVEEPIRLILEAVTISNSTGAAINVEQAADKVVIILAEGSQNTLSDASNYVYPSSNVDEPNAALFSNDDLTIYGSGQLTVNGNYNDAVASKDGLVIRDANLIVNAADDGIRGKDYLVILNSTINITSGGDGMKSDNDDPEALGTIQITQSTVNISAEGDGISAKGQVEINSGTFNITTGGGSSVAISDDSSVKGIKSSGSLLINGGTFALNTADDSLHSNGSIIINGGTLTLASGDDGVHADVALEINADSIDITTCYEGLESNLITINGAEIHIKASDDGINGSNGSGKTQGGTQFGNVPGAGQGRTFPDFGSSGTQSTPDASQFGNIPGGNQNGTMPGFPGNSGQAISMDSSSQFAMNGGYVYVNAEGDGVDVNGTGIMTGGTLLVDGPTNSGNSALDFNSYTVTGGLLVAAGSAGMAMAPSTDSSQPSLFVALDNAASAGTLFSLQDETGNVVVAYTPAKPYQTLVVSSPELKLNAAYTVLTGGSSSGTEKDGLYSGGNVSNAQTVSTVTLAATVNTVGNAGGFQMPGGGQRR